MCVTISGMWKLTLGEWQADCNDYRNMKSIILMPDTPPPTCVTGLAGYAEYCVLANQGLVDSLCTVVSQSQVITDSVGRHLILVLTGCRQNGKSHWGQRSSFVLVLCLSDWLVSLLSSVSTLCVLSMRETLVLHLQDIRRIRFKLFLLVAILY